MRPAMTRLFWRAAIAASAFAVAGALATAAVSAAPAAVAAPDQRDDTAACRQGDPDTCDGDPMRQLAVTGERLVTEYLTGIGIAGDSLPRLRYIAAGGSATSQCVDVNGQDAQHDRSYNYCVTDNTVYLGQETLRDFSQRYGPWGPISGIAHEYGHFLQAVRHVPSPVGAAETIRNENQADCFSGAFVKSVEDRDTAQPAITVDSIERYLRATASVDAPGRDHGTAPERIDSFALGHRGGLAACSQFFPATPLTG